MRAGVEEFLQVGVQKIERAAAAVLQPEREAALRAETGNRRGHHRKGRRFGHGLTQTRVERVDDRADVEAGAALIPRLEADEVERVVARRHAGQKAEAGNRDEVCDAVSLQQRLIDFARDRVRALQRGGRRQLHVEQHVSIVLVGNETRRKAAAEKRGACGERRKQRDAKTALRTSPWLMLT